MGRLGLGRGPHGHPADRRGGACGRHSGRRHPTVKGLIALLGGTLAAGTHLTKAGTRAAANTSPEPFSNWMLSLGEDVFVIGLSALALKYPIAAALVVILGVDRDAELRGVDRPRHQAPVGDAADGSDDVGSGC